MHYLSVCLSVCLVIFLADCLFWRINVYNKAEMFSAADTSLCRVLSSLMNAEQDQAAVDLWSKTIVLSRWSAFMQL